MIKEITVDELRELKNRVLVDVRSESEYYEATIPGSVNIPLLNDIERTEVGTLYVQESPEKARKHGLDIISPKLPELVKTAEKIGKEGSLVLFCWRGGMRSKSFAALLDLMGIPVYRLQGGYKAYRRKVVDYFSGELPVHVFVLRGNTGVGKTEILKRLRDDGYPAIDLEKFANNRGSVFGAVGLGHSPTQKAFESMLYEDLKGLQQHSYIIVECESKRIGRVMLPETFHQAMQKGTQILMYDTVENRVNRLLKEYTAFPDALQQIGSALERLVKIMGHHKVNELKDKLAKGDLHSFTESLLIDYYDHLYGYPNEPSSEYAYHINYQETEKAIADLEMFFDQDSKNFLKEIF